MLLQLPSYLYAEHNPAVRESSFLFYKIMYLSHPKKNIRDTAAYLPLRSNNGRPKALRHIAAEILGVTIQDGEHCSVSTFTYH